MQLYSKYTGDKYKRVISGITAFEVDRFDNGQVEATLASCCGRRQSSKPRRPLSLTCYTQCTMFSNAFRGTFIAQKSLANCLIAVN